jgi:hypothetical protein
MTEKLSGPLLLSIQRIGPVTEVGYEIAETLRLAQSFQLSAACSAAVLGRPRRFAVLSGVDKPGADALARNPEPPKWIPANPKTERYRKAYELLHPQRFRNPLR